MEEISEVVDPKTSFDAMWPITDYYVISYDWTFLLTKKSITIWVFVTYLYYYTTILIEV